MINHNILDIIIKYLDPLTVFELTRLNKKFNTILDKYIFYTLCLEQSPNLLSGHLNYTIEPKPIFILEKRNPRYKIHICAKKKFITQDINLLCNTFGGLAKKYIGSTYHYISPFTHNIAIVQLDSINNLSYNGLISI